MTTQRTLRTITLFAVWAVLPLSDHLASADTIWLSTSVRWVAKGQSCVDTGTNSANCTQTITYPAFPFPGEFEGYLTAEAYAEYGALAIDLLANTPGPDAFSSMAGSASFADELTISGGTGEGFVQYVFDLEAWLSTENSLFGPSLLLGLTHDGVSETLLNSTANSLFFHSQYVSPLLPFVWDEPFLFSSTLSSNITSSSAGQNSVLSASLLGIRVFNADGSAAAVYGIDSAADASYETAVPEPATLSLLALGCAGFIARRMRAMRRSEQRTAD